MVHLVDDTVYELLRFLAVVRGGRRNLLTVLVRTSNKSGLQSRAEGKTRSLGFGAGMTERCEWGSRLFRWATTTQIRFAERPPK